MSKIFRLLLLLILLSSMTPPVYAQSEPLRMHPALVTLAQSRSDTMVKVVVQQEADSMVSSQSLSYMGGENARELPLINGFAIEVPAHALADLADTPGVKWISPDAPMSSSTSFGQDGVIMPNIGSSSAATATAIDANGRVLIAGAALDGSYEKMMVARYNDDGSLDSTFGSGGYISTEVSFFAFATAITVQTDGKILVAGAIYNASTSYDFLLVRYQSNGVLDTTFGTNGFVTLSPSAGDDVVNGIALQANGKILVVGREQNNYLMLARYTVSGQRDLTFDGDGMLVTTLTISLPFCNPVALQSDGKLVVTGTKDYGDNRGSTIAVARYDSNGALDTGFGRNGYAVTRLNGAEGGTAIKVQQNGKLVVTGITYTGSDTDLIVLRYNSNGTLDTTFAGAGIVTTNLGGDEFSYAIAIQSDNKILISGSTYIWNGTIWVGKVALARYTSNGVLDSSFDGDGFTLTQIKSAVNYSLAMALQNNGKIVLAGYVEFENAYNIITLRYTSSGSLDIGVNPILPSVRADLLRQQYPTLQGSGVTVAVVDSGINSHRDLQVGGSNTSRVIGNIDFSRSGNTNDSYGHGTHVAGLIGANGVTSTGLRGGVAPNVNLLNLKVSNSEGVSYISDVIAALNWIYQNKNLYNIRVVNLSMNSVIAESYHTSPLNAALEILWFNGIVVVVAAGNNGTGSGPVTLYPPANDPFVITVGATDQVGTSAINDDVVASFSAYGITEDGYTKPDLVAPGRNMVSLLASTTATIYNRYSTYRVDSSLFRMSGTSMATPIVSGAVAVLLQDEPNLTPDQVKHRLLATASKNWVGYDETTAGAGYLDLYAAVTDTTTQSANTGTPMSQLLFSQTGTTVLWDSVSWNSVSWNSVSWNSVSWNSVSWNSTSSPTAVWSSSLWDEATSTMIPAEVRPDESGALADFMMHKIHSPSPTSTPDLAAPPSATEPADVVSNPEETDNGELTTIPQKQLLILFYLPLITQAGQ